MFTNTFLKVNKYHIYFWIINYIIHCVTHFTNYSTTIYWYSLFIILINLIFKIIAFYITFLYIIPLLWEKKRYFYFIFFMGLTLLGIILMGITFYLYVPVAENDNSVNSWISDLGVILHDVGNPLPFAFAFYYAEKITLQQQAQREIEQENFKLEQSIIDTQLNNLKNQINPDFLFRKLDYFYQESLPHSASLSKGISLLSDMMHYAIDDDDEDGKVLLDKEIQHIRNFIEINQLRFDGRLKVIFEVVGETEYLKIMPLVLITFVENAFKYGELNDANNPLKIDLKIEGNQLTFSTYNRTRRGPKEQSEGIGIANTQKRLALGYPDQDHLEIKSEADFYEVQLAIEL
jgi:two-component system, LytTR family, sensor kinase